MQSKVPGLVSNVKYHAGAVWAFLVQYSLWLWQHIVHYSHSAGIWLQENVFTYVRTTSHRSCCFKVGDRGRRRLAAGKPETSVTRVSHFRVAQIVWQEDVQYVCPAFQRETVRRKHPKGCVIIPGSRAVIQFCCLAVGGPTAQFNQVIVFRSVKQFIPTHAAVISTERVELTCFCSRVTCKILQMQIAARNTTAMHNMLLFNLYIAKPTGICAILCAKGFTVHVLGSGVTVY